MGQFPGFPCWVLSIQQSSVLSGHLHESIKHGHRHLSNSGEWDTKNKTGSHHSANSPQEGKGTTWWKPGPRATLLSDYTKPMLPTWEYWAMFWPGSRPACFTNTGVIRHYHLSLGERGCGLGNPSRRCGRYLTSAPLTRAWGTYWSAPGLP